MSLLQICHCLPPPKSTLLPILLKCRPWVQQKAFYIEQDIKNTSSSNLRNSFDPPGIDAYLEEEQDDKVHCIASFGDSDGSINTITILDDSGSINR